MTFNVGENIGSYRNLEQLDQGGMATVYKAYHAALDRYAALQACTRRSIKTRRLQPVSNERRVWSRGLNIRTLSRSMIIPNTMRVRIWR